MRDSEGCFCAILSSLQKEVLVSCEAALMVRFDSAGRKCAGLQLGADVVLVMGTRDERQ